MATGKHLSNVGKSEGAHVPSQLSLRTHFHRNVLWNTILLYGVLLVILYPILWSLLFDGKEFFISGFFYPYLVFSILCSARFWHFLFKEGQSFKCAHCEEFYAHDTHWVCGYCHITNLPGHRDNNHLFDRCKKCSSIALGLLCKACNQIIQLTESMVDTKRYARVYGVAPNERPEIIQLRQEQEIERARRQYQQELEREQRQARAKELSSNLEILAEKIKNTKQFERAARTMVDDLKKAGDLDDYEEKVLLEIIKDKVWEEFHVDRRGGRTRH